MTPAVLSPADLRQPLSEEQEHALALANEILEVSEVYTGLTLRESWIIGILKAAAGRAVPPGVLAEAIARDALNPSEGGSAKVMVSKIRKKRPDLGERIATVWGRGYAWRAAQ